VRTTRRLKEVLGGDPSDLTWDQLESLIANGVEESEDLDFKTSHYENSDKDKRELAKDVAALANSLGGILLIGVKEDDFGKASTLTPVSIDQNQGLTYRQIFGLN
jgi:predicted HTH transcriptional regulator